MTVALLLGLATVYLKDTCNLHGDTVFLDQYACQEPTTIGQWWPSNKIRYRGIVEQMLAHTAGQEEAVRTLASFAVSVPGHKRRVLLHGISASGVGYSTLAHILLKATEQTFCKVVYISGIEPESESRSAVEDARDACNEEMDKVLVIFDDTDRLSARAQGTLVAESGADLFVFLGALPDHLDPTAHGYDVVHKLLVNPLTDKTAVRAVLIHHLQRLVCTHGIRALAFPAQWIDDLYQDYNKETRAKYVIEFISSKDLDAAFSGRDGESIELR